MISWRVSTKKLFGSQTAVVAGQAIDQPALIAIKLSKALGFSGE
jgi:hypothetical protein